MEIQSFRAHSVKVVASSGCRHDVSRSGCLLTLAFLSAEGVVVPVISCADIGDWEKVRLLPVGSIATNSPVRPRAGTRGEHHDAAQLRYPKKRGCFQGEENELFTHTHPSDETSPHEQKGSLNTLPTRTVVMKTSHETSTGAAKQTWSTSSLGGSWALRNNVNLQPRLQMRTPSHAQPSTDTHPTRDGASPQRPYGLPSFGGTKYLSLGDTPSQLSRLRTRETNNHVTGVSGQRQGAHGRFLE